MHPFEAKDVALVRRNLLVHALAVAPLVVGLVLLVLGVALRHGALATAGSVLAWTAYFVASVTFAKNPRARARRVELRVDDDGLSVDGTRVARPAEVLQAYLEPLPDRGPRVRVAIAGAGTLDLQTHDDAHARALLAALGRGATQHAAWWRARVEDDRWPLRLALVFAAAYGALAMAVLLLQALGLAVYILPATMAAALAAIRWSGRTSRVTVGADGIHVVRRGGARFLSYADVVDAQVEGARVRVVMREGPPVVVDFAQKVHGGVIGHAHAAFALRLREAIDAYRARQPDQTHARVLARGEKTAAQWLEELRALAEDGDAYRTAALAPETLWRIVDDPAADPTARAGAAAMLRRALDEPGRARLRVAASASASPRLRVALDAVAADDDEQAIALALADVHEG